MSKINFEEYFQNLNIDDIFERKIEVGSLIHFSLLQKIIEEFIKRQKLMNDKINYLEEKFNAIPFNKGIAIKGFKNYINNEKNLKEINFNKDYKEKENTKITDEEGNKSDKVIEKEGIDKSEDINIYLNENNIDETDKIKYLSYRVDKLESLNMQLVKIRTEIKNDILNLSENTDDKMKEQNNKINKILKDIKSLDSKVEENTILSRILKLNENTDNNQLSILIQALDEKINRKINSIEEHNKDNEEQIIKYKKDIIDLKNINQGIIQSSNKIKENYSSLLKDFNIMKNKYENELNELNKIIDDKTSEVKTELLKYSNEQNKKISDLIIEQNSLAQKNKNDNKNIDTKILSSLYNEKIENMSIELKHLFSKGILDSENNLKSIINDLGIEKIRTEIIKIHQELENKLVQKDLSKINYKIDEIETKNYGFKNQNEEFDNKIEFLTSECSKNKNMIDYLAAEIIKFYKPEFVNSSKKNTNYINELKSFVSKDIFEKETTKIFKKIEKILEFEDENNKYIQLINEKLENYVTDIDLKNMQHYILNIIEEFKILSNKKFLDKKDGHKSFKYLELQIKTINENINLNSQCSSGENWMLAKKPLNNYLCASCESFIGELKDKNKNEYLSWNKISPREGNKYRMGQGFSRMLQMVNMDLMKSAEKINDDLTIKVDDNQNIKKNFKYKLIPRINSSRDLRKNKNKSVNSYMKIKEIKDNELNLSNINSVLNSTSVGNKNINSNDSINDKSKGLNLRNIDKFCSPKLIYKNIQTYSTNNKK